MKFDAQKALIAYSGVLTAVVVGLLVAGAARAPGKAAFTEIDVQRINVREPDGVLRMVISNQALWPGLIIKGHEYPHPNRKTAGLLFFNEEGSENGGLIFDGREKDGRRTNSGSLTFDRYHQDQTIQIISDEDGPDRHAGLIVTDRPDGPMDFTLPSRLNAIPEADRPAALKAGHFGGVQRAFLGRADDGVSQLSLRDGEGRKRLILAVTPEGEATIQFLDATGKVVRTVTPSPEAK
ncbi:hypothetical protein [Caulobacter sp. LARHSG274]